MTKGNGSRGNGSRANDSLSPRAIRAHPSGRVVYKYTGDDCAGFDNAATNIAVTARRGY